MPTVQKRTQALGVEPIPKFARYATLCLGNLNGSTVADFPEANSIYNIACLGFFRHAAGRGAITQSIRQPNLVTYWGTHSGQGTDLVFGCDKVAIPMASEWYGIAWLRLPSAGVLGPGPYYEDYFDIAWELAL